MHRAAVIACIKGNGSKKPFLIMGHSDTVKIDPAKWTFPPFSASRNAGYVYGRGTLDDKSNLFAAMMTLVLLKRTNAKLDRDVIFVSEAGEESASGLGIGYLVSEHIAMNSLSALQTDPPRHPFAVGTGQWSVRRVRRTRS